MGITKTDIFTPSQNKLASLAKVLGHPARIAIIQHLVKVNSCVCGSLVDEIGLAQATISQHLKELKSIEIIQGNIEGTSVCYCINPDKWNEYKNQLTVFFDAYNPLKDSCC